MLNTMIKINLNLEAAAPCQRHQRNLSAALECLKITTATAQTNSARQLEVTFELNNDKPTTSSPESRMRTAGSLLRQISDQFEASRRGSEGYQRQSKSLAAIVAGASSWLLFVLDCLASITIGYFANTTARDFASPLRSRSLAASRG